MSGKEAKVPDFTGHWKQVKNENADGYLKTMGAPFPLRRIAVPIMGRSTDIVKQAGDLQVVTTINVKGAWTRKYIVGQEVKQKNAEGDDTVATCWWDAEEAEVPGKLVHKSKMVGGKRGPSESWRWYDGAGAMVIKSIVHCKNGKQAWMLWYFESIEPVRNEKFLSAKQKLKQITREQKLINEITEKQTEELKEAMKDLNNIQQAFVLEMLSKMKKSKDGESPAAGAAGKWKKKAVKAAPPAEKKKEEGASEEFYDCDDLTEEQIEVLDKQTREIEEKVMPVSFDEAPQEEEGGAGGVKTILGCIQVPSPSKVKRLPTVVLNSLKDNLN
eukprot:CAMPEP_0197490516 /NCGR_PEP_ID=MMETSP1311-20131121/5048_1 /TAXON_ID=464262 /ORGANISM="Genus nov. species nov., Strain RCC856" /LENGTH=328 /DNA_ID=CAMNT_0043035051 /DNA_START=212 /DNA_END=1198 /DNA_ORIENTATION=+